MEITAEIDASDVTECQHDHKPNTGMFCVLCIHFSVYRVYSASLS